MATRTQNSLRAGAVQSSRSPGSTHSPTPCAPCATQDEVTRFLRDLCTLPELEALAHRWQTVAAARRGGPYVEIAERVPTSTATVTRVAQWLRHGTGGTGWRSTGSSAKGRHERHVHASRRERPAHARGARERPHGRARPASVRRRGALVRDTERSLVVPVRERARRPAARAPERHPRVRAGRCRPPRHHRREPGRRGAGDVLTLAELGFARCTLAGGGPRRTRRRRRSRISTGLRVATAYPVSTRCCWTSAASRPSSCPSPARSRQRRGSGSRTRSSTSSPPARRSSANGLRRVGDAARFAGRSGRRAAAPSRAGEPGRRGSELMLSGVVAARRRRYVMMNATVDALAGDPRRAAEHGRADGAHARRRGRDRRSRRRRRRRHLDAAPAAEGGGRLSILVLPVERIVP